MDKKLVVQRSDSLMYTPHPTRNAIGAMIGDDLANAVRHRHVIPIGILREMRRVVFALATATAKASPDFVPFFATGGIPYIIPLLFVLDSRQQHQLVDGSRFHMFPGLAWGGRYRRQTTEELFIKHFGPLVARKLGEQSTAHVLAIDTTNTGNSAKRFVNSMQQLCETLRIRSPKGLVVEIISIVNGKNAVTPKHERSTPHRIKTKKGDVPVVLPEGYEPKGAIRDRVFARFERTDGDDLFQLRIAYWVVGDIPTEDNADLLGVRADHAILGARAGITPGRISLTMGGRPS